MVIDQALPLWGVLPGVWQGGRTSLETGQNETRYGGLGLGKKGFVVSLLLFFSATEKIKIYQANTRIKIQREGSEQTHGPGFSGTKVSLGWSPTHLRWRLTLTLMGGTFSKACMVTHLQLHLGVYVFMTSKAVLYWERDSENTRVCEHVDGFLVIVCPWHSHFGLYVTDCVDK